jgi:hypothetical protein
MSLNLAFHFAPDERALVVGFAPGGGAVDCQADVEYFTATLEARCKLLKQRVHFFFDLTHLAVEAELVEPFTAAKRALCERHALSVWHCGGHLAERVMTRNDCTRRGQKPNLYRTRDDAMAAFHKTRSRAGARG